MYQQKILYYNLFIYLISRARMIGQAKEQTKGPDFIIIYKEEGTKNLKQNRQRVLITQAGGELLKKILTDNKNDKKDDKKQKPKLKRPSCSWNASSLKSESDLRIKLQAEIEKLKNQCGFGQVQATNHHILPGAKIKLMLFQALKKDKTINLINEYINSRKGIKNYLKYLVQSKRGEQTIQQVYAAIFWHEFNLVLGPSSNRSNDPKDQNDYQMGKAIQSKSVTEQYKQIYRYIQDQQYYQALTIFLQKRQMRNGKWNLDNGNWNLFPNKSQKVFPATTGFFYDYEQWPWK